MRWKAGAGGSQEFGVGRSMTMGGFTAVVDAHRGIHVGGHSIRLGDLTLLEQAQAERTRTWSSEGDRWCGSQAST